MTGQQEKITYRVVCSSAKENESFLPAQGVGAGVGEELGIVLNRIFRGSPSHRVSRVVRQVTGTVVEENAGYVTLELRDRRRLKIRVTDIVRRTKL